MNRPDRIAQTLNELRVLGQIEPHSTQEASHIAARQDVLRRRLVNLRCMQAREEQLTNFAPLTTGRHRQNYQPAVAATLRENAAPAALCLLLVVLVIAGLLQFFEVMHP